MTSTGQEKNNAIKEDQANLNQRLCPWPLEHGDLKAACSHNILDCFGVVYVCLCFGHLRRVLLSFWNN